MRLFLLALTATVLLTAPNHTAAETRAAQLCQTSTRLEGTLYQGTWGMLDAPVVFDRAESLPRLIDIYPTVDWPLGAAVQAALPGVTTVSFFEGDELVHTCNLNVIAFDPDLHRLDMIGHGRCPLSFDRDLPTLTGIARYAEVPSFVEIAVGRQSVLLAQPVSRQAIYLAARTAGVTNLALLGQGGALIALCPIVVQDAVTYIAQHQMDPAWLCRDDSGAALRLTPGETANIT